MENQIEVQQLLELDVQTLETLDQCSEALGRVSEQVDAHAAESVTHAKSGIMYALKGGLICLRAKEISEHGQYGEWLNDQASKYGRSPATLYNWIKLAKFQKFGNLNAPDYKNLSDAYRAIGVLPEPEPKQGGTSETDAKVKLPWSPLKFSTRIEQWTKEQAMDFIYEFDRAAQFVRALRMEFGL